MRKICNDMIQTFMDICLKVGVPLADEKTEWASSLIVLLGILLDGSRMILTIPEEKRQNAIFSLQKIIDKKKTTVRELQLLCGYLNFLNKAIYPGHVFLRRMYAKYSNICDINGNKKKQLVLKPHHHISLDKEFKSDCRIWLQLLQNQQIIN